MSTFEPSPDLDPVVSNAIQEAMASLRAEFIDAGLSPASGSPPSEPDHLGELDAAVRELDRAATQTDLLASLLQEAGRFAERTLFLVRNDEVLGGWAAYGFGAGGEDVTALSLVGGAWATLLASGEAVELDADDCRDVSAPLGARHAHRGALVPFALRGQVAGALYADGDDTDLRALRLLGHFAARALETLPGRQPEGGASRAADASADEFVDETATPVTPAPVVDSEVEEAVENVTRQIEEVDDAAPEATDGDFVSIHHEVTPETFDTVIEDFTDPETFDLDAEPESLDQVVTAEIDNLEVEPEPAVDPNFATQEISTLEAEPLDPPAVAEAATRVVEQSEFAPPTDLDGPGWAFGEEEGSETDARHEEARRLARLLVTEIKLYNEEKVRQAREGGTLYDALREDIDRSQRIYDERIDEEVRGESDYFKEELVRILAGGDSTALGA